MTSADSAGSPEGPRENPQDLWEGPPPEWTPRRRPRATPPLGTIAVGALSLAIYLQTVFSGNWERQAGLLEWLSGSRALWDGCPWVLLTSTLVHVEIWHIATNFMFLYFYGPLLEKAIGSWRWVVFYLVSAFVTSGVQLAASGEIGIGMSGVLYAFYGFMWMSRSRYREFVAFFSPNMTIVPLGWLLLCFVLTWSGAMNIGNAAHVSGLVLGVAVSEMFVARRRRAFWWASATAMGCLAALVMFWCPWQGSWEAWQALRAHREGRLDEALGHYRRATGRQFQPSWALGNMALVHAQRNSWAAYERTCGELLSLDRDKAREIDDLVWTGIGEWVRINAPDLARESVSAESLDRLVFALTGTGAGTELPLILHAGVIGAPARPAVPALEGLASGSGDPDIRAAARLALKRIRAEQERKPGREEHEETAPAPPWLQ